MKDVSVKIFFIVCGLLLAAAEVFAVQPKLEIAELTHEADVIVEAKVTDIQTRPSRAGALTTLVTLAVEEAWKGAPAGQITVAVQGGVAGDVAQAVSGEPRFSPGERAILFLKAKGDRYTIVGGRQGKLIIKTGADGHEAAEDITGAMKDIGHLRAEAKAAGR